MRFGGFIFGNWNSPEEWAQKNVQAGYRAVYFPLDYTAETREIDAYVSAAKAADLVIAEIGVWNNPISREKKLRDEAVEKCVRQLALADYVGAKCCVNISGSRGDQWDGPHPENFSEETFALVVETTQKIIDRVQPENTFYTLEPMPWMYPDSAESYLELLRHINRPGFGVHLDAVNMICSPRLYYENGAFVRDFFQKLAPHIKSCHAKDIVLKGNLTLHLEECRPGLGAMDFTALLQCMEKLPPDVPIMLEHMTQEEDYVEATKFLKSLAKEIQIRL